MLRNNESDFGRSLQALNSEALPFGVHSHSGALIVLEGASCSGKSTFLKQLHHRVPDIVTVEWNSHPEIRATSDRLKAQRKLDGIAHSLISLLDYRLTYTSSVLPAVNDGKIVVTDRYIFTAFARDLMRSVSFDLLWSLTSHFLQPGLTLYFEIDEEERMRRYQSRASSYGYYACGLDVFDGS